MKESTKQFMYELADLLEKHKVEIKASNEWTGYAECGQDIQIYFDINDNEEIMLGTYVDSDKLRLKAIK
ncbi:MAG: hypothetical protein GY793_09870 [Proteobacteria bacterium]|nr:hypothetical protein [Pseudomonadota bacterium]